MASGASVSFGSMSMMVNTFSAEAKADWSQLNCSASSWMGVKNFLMYM